MSNQAAWLEGKEQLRIVDQSRPVCGANDVLLQIAACGICGGDARSYFVGDQFKARIPGHEAVGVVVEVGSRVSQWQSGDRLALAADLHCGNCYYCRHELYNMCVDLRILGKHMDGGMADFMLLTLDILQHGIVNRIPNSLPMLHAAISEPLSSILSSHDELAIAAGENVVIIGSGPMGVLHHLLLRVRNARTLLVDISGERLERARNEFGASIIINAAQENVVERVKELTDGLGADVVIAAAPSAAAVAQSVDLVRKRGRIGLFGGLPAAQAEVALNINKVHYSELRLLGNFSYHPRYHRDALRVLAEGGLDCEKLITTYPLERTVDGFTDIRAGRILKAVVIPNNGAML